MIEYVCEKCGILVMLVIGPLPPEPRYCAECRFVEGIQNPDERKQAEDFFRRRDRRERAADEPDDTDPRNPVDLSADDWRDIMSDPDYPDDDQEP
jgi:hypothetical protein